MATATSAPRAVSPSAEESYRAARIADVAFASALAARAQPPPADAVTAGSTAAVAAAAAAAAATASDESLDASLRVARAAWARLFTRHPALARAARRPAAACR